MPTWAELLAGKSPDQVFDELILGLKGLTPPFPVNDWAPGAAVRTVLKKGISPVVSRLYTVITSLTKGGFLRLAQEMAEADGLDAWEKNGAGSFLALLAQHKFQIKLLDALFAEGLIRFTAAAGAGPYNLSPGQFWASTDGGLRYSNFNPAVLVLPRGGTIDVPFRAEFSGSKYNVGVGQIRTLNVSLPGVSIENVAQPNGTWITQYGASKETPKELADRCAARYGAIGQDGNVGIWTSPADGPIYRAKTASVQVKKVTAWSNYYQGIARPNCVTLFLAGDTGPVGPPVVDLVKLALNPYRGINGTLHVESCVARTIFVQGVIWLRSAQDAAIALDSVKTNLTNYQRRAAIGETVYAAQIIEEVMGGTGVVDFAPLPLFNVGLGRNEVPVFDTSGLTADVLVNR